MPAALDHRSVAALLLAACVLAGMPPRAAARDEAPATRPNRIDNPKAADARMVVGWTHERWSPDRLPEGAGAEAGRRILAAAAPLQNTNILGWGMPSPMPAPGVENFGALDQRVQMMLRTARWPVITLCCAPDWMKAPPNGAGEQARFEQAPQASAYAAFASLSARVAQRYPQVRHFMVWNELKGFWDGAAQRWDAAAYTELYNQVYKAVKAVRPDALIGGPYVVLDSFQAGTPEAGRLGSDIAGAWGTVDRRALEVIDYWLEHKAGADFIVLDASIMPRRGGLAVAPAQALDKFAATQQWVRRKTSLPLWWAEFYPSTRELSGAAALQQLSQAIDMAEAGGATALLFWNPVCRADAEYGREACLWNDGGGAAVQDTGLAQWLARRALAPQAKH